MVGTVEPAGSAVAGVGGRDVGAVDVREIVRAMVGGVVGGTVVGGLVDANEIGGRLIDSSVVG